MPATRLNDRAVIRLSPLDEGEDVAAFLQGLVTNDVTTAAPVYAALLSAQGKTMLDFIVWREGANVLLDCEAAHVDELVNRLSLYRLRRRIAIARDDALAVHWSLECDLGVADPRLAALGQRWIGPAAAAEPADELWRAHRLALGVPEGREEMADVLWLETNAVELNGVSFTKGCYVGQENTARMNWRQKVNRRLVVVPIGTADEKRTKVRYEALGLAVVHQRVEDIDPADVPGWMNLEA